MRTAAKPASSSTHENGENKAVALLPFDGGLVLAVDIQTEFRKYKADFNLDHFGVSVP